MLIAGFVCNKNILRVKSALINRHRRAVGVLDLKD